MESKIKVILVFGTRPEAIKMAPLVLKLRNNDLFDSKVLVTAQHREMLDQVLSVFNITPDYDLDLMSKGQTLTDVTCKVMQGVEQIYNEENPDIVLVHGDTATSTAAALAAYYKQIPVGHVEAGLRTGNIYSPFPEEMNRKITGAISTYHFAPTKMSFDNLISEGVNGDKIIVTGNTVIDSLKLVTSYIKSKDFDVLNRINFDKKLILITGHRRENFGKGFENICRAISKLSKLNPDVEFIYPMHLNPNVRKPVLKYLQGKDNILLIEPLDYEPFVKLMSESYLILTDSGGIQEEAPSLGKPVLVMRDTTERPEAVEAGTVKLVGTNTDIIIDSVNELLHNEESYNTMSKSHNPYGDGNACDSIISYILNAISKEVVI